MIRWNVSECIKLVNICEHFLFASEQPCGLGRGRGSCIWRKTDTGARNYFPKVVVNNSQSQDSNQCGWTAEKTHFITTLNHHLPVAHSPSGRKTHDCHPSLILRGWVFLCSGHRQEVRAILGWEVRPHTCSDEPSLFSFQCSVPPNLALGSSLAAEVTEQASSHRRDCMTPRSLRRVFKRV